MPIVPGEQSSDQSTPVSAPPSIGAEPVVKTPSPRPSEPTPKAPEMEPHPNGRAPTNNIEAYAESVLNQPPKPAKDPEAELEAFANDALKPIDDNEEQDKLLAASLDASFAKDPKKAARVLELEKYTGLPGDFIERNQDEIEKQYRAGTFSPSEYRARSPKLSKWMSENQNNAGAVKNDVNWFESLEGGTRKQSVSKDIWDAVGAGLAGLNSSIAKAPAYLADLAYAPQNILADKLDIPSLKYTPPKSIGNNKVTRYFDDAAKNLAPSLASASITDELAKGVETGNFNRAAETLAIQFAQNFPNQAALLIGALSGYGTAALVGAGLTSASTKNAENKEKGVDPSISAIGATATGVVEAGFENLGTFGILRKWEAAIASKYGQGAAKQVFRDFGKTMAASAGGEFNEEFWTSIVQDSIDMSIGADQSPLNLDTAGQMGKRALDAGILGGVSGATMTGPAATLSGYARVNSDHRAQAQIKHQQDFLQVLEAGAGSELYKNSPAVMQKAVNAVTEGTPLAQVRIEAESWRKYWQSKGEDPKAKAAELMGDDGSSYDVALESGQDIGIPTGAYAAKIVGTEHSAELNQDVKLGENGRSPRQIQEDVKQADLESKETLAKHDQEFDVIKDRFEKNLRLVSPNDSESDIRNKADFAARGIRGLAEKSKKSMADIYEKHGLELYSEATGIRVGGEESVSFAQNTPREEIPIVKLNDPGETQERAPLRQRLVEKFFGKTAVNEDTGYAVKIEREGINKALGDNPNDRFSRAALKQIDEVIRHATWDKAINDRKDTTKKRDHIMAFHTLYAPVELDGEVRVVRLTVKEIANEAGKTGHEFYLHEISESSQPAGNEKGSAGIHEAVETSTNTVSKTSHFSGPSLDHTASQPAEIEKRPAGISGSIESSTNTDAQKPRYSRPTLHITELGSLVNAERSIPGRAWFQEEQGRNLSPLGFYSQVEEVISKMDFKQIPAKDLAGRIANVQGIKKDELEHLGLLDWLNSQDGKVSKEDVLNYVREKTIKVEQVVLANDFKELGDSVSSELDWSEQERDTGGNDDDIESEVSNDMSDSYWMKERRDEMYPGIVEELTPEYITDDGEIDDQGLHKAAEEAFQEKVREYAEESAREYVESDDYSGARYTVTEGNSGWTLTGSDEIGWYSPDMDEHFDNVNLNEAKIRLAAGLIEAGELNMDVAELSRAEDVDWKSPQGKLPEYNVIEKEARELFEKDKERFKKEELEKYPSLYEDETGAELDAHLEKEAFALAEREIEERYNDQSNPENEIKVRLDHPVLKGSIEGNDRKGYSLVMKDESFDLGAMPLEEAKAKAIQVMKDNGLVKSDKVAIEGDTVPTGVNDPSGKSKWHQYAVPGGTNYREVLLTLPKLGPEKFTYSTHWGAIENVVAHARLSDHTDLEGKKILLIEEIQSDQHQQGRERGYKTESADVQSLRATKDRLEKAMDDFKEKSVLGDVEIQDDPTYSGLMTEWRANQDNMVEALKAQDINENAVPDAPFKNTEAWSALVLKRMIRMATEQGYDGIAWTPGAVHVERWGTDSVSWVKKSAASAQIVVREDGLFSVEGEGVTVKGSVFSDRADAEKVLESANKDHWIVGSVEQVGGNAEGMDIEEQARRRGDLLEKHGERVNDIEDLRKIVSSTLNRERSQRSLDSITETVWKQMQENPEGIKRPRKEGMEFFYDNMLPKKAAPAVLKGLDKKAKVGISEINVSAEDYSDQEILKALGVEEGATSMKVWSISLTQEMRDNAMRGMTLFQNAPVGARGMMNVSPSGRIGITMFKKADLSTWYHEMSHAFLEIMHDLQKEEGADQAIKSEFSVATEWFASKDQAKSIAEVKGAAAAALAASQDDPSNERLQGQAVAAREALRLIEEGGEEFMREVGRTFGRNIEDAEVRHILITPFHEYFARGFEAYLREGVAPSNELKKLFRRMSKWLLRKYKELSDLKVELSPEIRGLYARLLATDQEIEEAESQTGSGQMLVKPSDILSESDARMYSEAVEDVKQDARERMNARLMKDVKKERTEWWNNERTRIREDIADQINKNKEYVALAFLGLGVQSDGSALPKDMMPVKISKESIVEKFGKDRLKELPRPYIYSAEGGVDVDEVAKFFDYGSGDEMLSALSAAEDKDSLIDRITDEQMKDQHGDKKLDEALPQEALDLVHSEKQAELLRMEMKLLAENKLGVLQKAIRQVGRGIPTVAQVREQAEARIAEKAIRDIKPIEYSRAEKRASKAAIEAVSRGDLVKAFEEKRKQLLNHELYRAARNAREQAEKYADYAHGLNKPAAQERIGKAQGEYLDQINALLDRFNFNTNTSVARGDRMKGLAAWLKEQAENGVVIDVNDKLLNEAYRTHWKEMTFGELKDVRDTLKQIEHLAKTKNKLLADKKARDFGEVKGSMISSIQAHHDTVLQAEELHPSFKDKIIDGLETARAKHTRIEVLSEFLDGNKAAGPVWENLFRPLARAQSKKTDMQHASTRVMEKVLEAYTPKERAELAVKKSFIPDFGESNILKPNFTKADTLVVALNWGNEGNRQALMEGYGWSEDQVMKILKTLDSRDWEVVQGIWGHIDSFWPQIAAQEKLLTGLVPEKVSAAPFVVRASSGAVHEVKGGYYPLKFDPRFSEKSNQNTGKEMVQDLFGGGFIRAATRHGHTKERVGSRGQKVMLDLGVLANHINTVIHDLTHRVAVMDAMKILEDQEIFGTISAAAGRPMAQQFKPWLASVSGSRTLNPDEHYSKVFSWLKTNSTMVFLGFKLTSALVQGVDAFVAANEIGEKWMLRGVREAYFKNKPSASWGFATARSEHMRNLIEHKQREIRELLQTQGMLEGATKMDDFKQLAMKPAHFADSAIALAIWTGSYHKALEGHLENIKKGDEVAAAEYADRTVRTTQMAGDPKDESSIQRGTPLWKMFTQFYTPMNVAFNQMQKHLVMEQQLNGFQVGQFMHSVMMLVIFPVIYELSVRGKMGAGDEDDEYSWLKNIVGHTLLYPFEHVIGLRDLVKLFTSNEMGRSHFSPSPAYSALESLADTYKAGSMAIDKGELDRKTVKAVTMSAGYMGGLPVRQFWMTGEYTFDWMTGEETPDNAAEGAWRALVIGKPRKK